MWTHVVVDAVLHVVVIVVRAVHQVLPPTGHCDHDLHTAPPSVRVGPRTIQAGHAGRTVRWLGVQVHVPQAHGAARGCGGGCGRPALRLGESQARPVQGQSQALVQGPAQRPYDATTTPTTVHFRSVSLVSSTRVRAHVRA